MYSDALITNISTTCQYYMYMHAFFLPVFTPHWLPVVQFIYLLYIKVYVYSYMYMYLRCPVSRSPHDFAALLRTHPYIWLPAMVRTQHSRFELLGRVKVSQLYQALGLQGALAPEDVRTTAQLLDQNIASCTGYAHA